MASLRFTTRDIQSQSSLRCDCVILPLSTSLRLDDTGQAVAKDSAGTLNAALKGGDFSGKTGEAMLLAGPGDARRILLVGTGEGSPDREDQRKIIAAIGKHLQGTTIKEALFFCGPVARAKSDWTWFCTHLAKQLGCDRYTYDHTLSKKKPAPALKRFTLVARDKAAANAARPALKEGLLTAEGINVARELANLPGNYCTPEHLAKEARKLARGNDKTSCKVLNEKAMAELGMHSLLSVSAGSAQPAKLIVVEYNGGGRKDAPHVLVGKGITFDSGGISLKPGAKMDEMKFDMGGAASVMGTLHAAISMQLPINLVGIIAAAENMPSGTATKPGDVVTSMAGITIEILNTDAEGRLVLCDALTYAERFKPASVVDIATLTGACVVALGNHASGLYANDESLAQQLLSAGITAHDRAWQMPLWEDYQQQLNSNFADVANIGGPGAGSVTAACFLSRFTKAYKWAHLDIAGSAWNSSPKGATGRPVGLLTQYLLDRVSDA